LIGDGRHEVERYNQLIEDFTDKKVFRPKLYPSPEDFKKVEPLSSGKYVCMAPASVWFTKQLPFEKWVELCNKTNSDIKIYLLGGPEDKQLCEKIRNTSSNKNIEVLAGELSLLQSCALMKNAQMNYVNDSAPMHLASSVNAPVTVFYCSTIPELGFGPLSDDSTILQVKDLKCRPCGIHGYKECPLGHFHCGKDISL
jgi:heptosyltransferase-2